ncbi:MAG: hypothetical protein JSW26_16330 [Desulfobacterales bacterium]|nr:MAG: hypothetical protein JSW26_16330 [Desulfobacterales bacterium]
MGKNENLILVLDVGTGSGRAILFDSRGKQVGLSQREWVHPRIEQHPGGFHFETSENWYLLKNCIHEVLAKPGIDVDNIAAVSSAAQRPGIVCYDAAGQELCAWPCFDARADGETEWIIEQGYGPKIYEINGDWPSIHEPARLLWLKKNMPQIFDKVARITMLDAWVLYKLTGQYVAEPTIASFSGMFDIHRRDWSHEILDLLKLPAGILPPMANSASIMGQISGQASRETGLRQGIPVVLGGGDTQLALLGAGLATEGAGLVAGTFWVEGIIVDAPLIDTARRKTRTFCHSLPDRWIIEAANFSGILARWFRDVFAKQEVAQAAKKGASAYEMLNSIAQKVPPGSNGMQVCFSSLFDSGRWIHTSPAFMGWDVFDSENSDKAVFWRAILENACYLAKGEFNLIRDVSGVPLKDVVFCGGASKSSLWQQILADVLETTVLTPEVVETTSLGAAMCGAVGAGFYDDLKEASAAMSPPCQITEPNHKNAEIYDLEYRRWYEICKHSLELVDKGVLDPMWAAPATRER